MVDTTPTLRLDDTALEHLTKKRDDLAARVGGSNLYALNLAAHLGESYITPLLADVKALKVALARLMVGVLAWSGDEDGALHDSALAPFKDAAALLGIALVPLDDANDVVYRDDPFTLSPPLREWLAAHE